MLQAKTEEQTEEETGIEEQTGTQKNKRSMFVGSS